jgi:hypothetical protein
MLVCDAGRLYVPAIAPLGIMLRRSLGPVSRFKQEYVCKVFHESVLLHRRKKVQPVHPKTTVDRGEALEAAAAHRRALESVQNRATTRTSSAVPVVMHQTVLADFTAAPHLPANPIVSVAIYAPKPPCK